MPVRIYAVTQCDVLLPEYLDDSDNNELINSALDLSFTGEQPTFFEGRKGAQDHVAWLLTEHTKRLKQEVQDLQMEVLLDSSAKDRWVLYVQNDDGQRENSYIIQLNEFELN